MTASDNACSSPIRRRVTRALPENGQARLTTSLYLPLCTGHMPSAAIRAVKSTVEGEFSSESGKKTFSAAFIIPILAKRRVGEHPFFMKTFAPHTGFENELREPGETPSITSSPGGTRR
ncbi:hypothetical protein GCM10027444_07600 [Actinopolyspora lacussalsi]